jgi:hypothetical protein
MVAFDDNWKELFRWGPRPEEAKKLFEDLKTAGIEKAVRLEKLHLWYGRNRGAALESEIKELLKLDL